MPIVRAIQSLSLAVLVLGGLFVAFRSDGVRTAAIVDTVPVHASSVARLSEPLLVAWEGEITRTLAGGRGIEVRSAMAETGWFFAYLREPLLTPIPPGRVRIHGHWVGGTCEYGRCAPEVDNASVEPLPPGMP